MTIELEPGNVSRLSESDARVDAGDRNDTIAKDTAEQPEATVNAAETRREEPAEATREARPAVDAAGEPSSDTGEKTSAGEGKQAVHAMPPARRGGLGAALLAGIVGGAVALVLGGALQWTGVLPFPANPGGQRQQVAMQSLGADLDALKKRVDALPVNGIDAATLKQTLQPFDKRLLELNGALDQVKATAAEAKSAAATGDRGAGESLRAVETRLAKLEQGAASTGAAAASSDAVATLAGKVAALEAAVHSAGQAATATDERLGRIEQSVAALEKKVDARAGDTRTAAAIAASALKSAIDSGAPFSAELDTFAAVAPDAPEIGELRKLAATGVPTRKRLAAEAGSAAEAMADAVQTRGSATGVVGRLLASAKSLVKVRPVGAPQGEDAGARIARFQADIESGELARAADEYDALPDKAKAAGADFMDRVGQRLAADDLARKALGRVLKSG